MPEILDENPVRDSLVRAFLALIDADTTEEQTMSSDAVATIEARRCTNERAAEFAEAMRAYRLHREARLVSVPGLAFWDIAMRQEPAHA